MTNLVETSREGRFGLKGVVKRGDVFKDKETFGCLCRISLHLFSLLSDPLLEFGKELLLVCHHLIVTNLDSLVEFVGFYSRSTQVDFVVDSRGGP
jgi:hypothetical protein